MKGMFSKRYRIVTDTYLDYHCEFRYWFWPFWFECEFSNTHLTLEGAERFIEAHRNRLVKYYD